MNWCCWFVVVMSLPVILAVSCRGRWTAVRGRSAAWGDSWMPVRRSWLHSGETKKSQSERTGGCRMTWPQWPERTKYVKHLTLICQFLLCHIWRLWRKRWGNNGSFLPLSVCAGCTCGDGGGSAWEGWTEAEGPLVHFWSVQDREADGYKGKSVTPISVPGCTLLILWYSWLIHVDPQEQENRDLLDRFRMAHSEVEEREQKLQQAEGLNSSIRLELLSSDTERRHLRDTVSQQEREIQQVR